MKFIIGFIIVIGMVFGGYHLHHGKFEVLWQPSEFMIIGGAAVGALIIGTPGHVIKEILKNLKLLFKGMPYKKPHYLELLVMLFATFKLMRSKGMLEMEQHIENPHQSSLFNAYPSFSKSHHGVTFFSDYLRIMTLGVEDYYTLEELMEREITVHRNHGKHIEHVMLVLADGMPALGIVAAVLGVITTMGSINEPVEILGGMIGAALVGTFLGVLLSYAFFAPMGRYLGEHYEAHVRYLECIKTGLLSHLKGNAPAVSVEFARTSLDEALKPSFLEVEDACSGVSIPGTNG